jgi:uncharacterized protein YcbK (DUF882 family)
MKRRHFLGLALSVAATPAFARTSQKTATERRRTISLRHLHTDEKIAVTYRIGDRYQRHALHKLNWFLRDFRTQDVTVIDPKLFDILYDINVRLGNPEGRFEILSGYRSAQTNAMLRRASGGVARNSLHMSGQALDIRLEYASTRRICECAVALSRGGVGHYPNADFVHIDTGEVRRWGA